MSVCVGGGVGDRLGRVFPDTDGVGRTYGDSGHEEADAIASADGSASERTGFARGIQYLKCRNSKAHMTFDVAAVVVVIVLLLLLLLLLLCLLHGPIVSGQLNGVYRAAGR